jgi:membrane associated rhomboid family serine protease
MLLPLKDINPTTRPPLVTVALIVLNIIVFVYEIAIGPSLGRFISAHGLVPAELTRSVDLALSDPGGAFAVSSGPPREWLTLLTSMFIHGGFLHIAGNMLYLWIFGNNIEDLLGPVRFLLFYLLCGIVAGIVHVLIAPRSPVPTVGASGAVAGILGAYLIAYPRARVVCLLFLVFFIRLIPVPAMLVLIFWFLLQAFEGAAAVSTGSSGGVAWFAHVGGFLAGILLIHMMAAAEVKRLRTARKWAARPPSGGYSA